MCLGAYDMDPRVAKLKTSKDCEKFAANAERLGLDDIVADARKRAVELRAQEHGSSTDAEKECLKAVYAYEEVISKKNGRRTRANRTWQMIKRHGIIGAAERAVNRDTETMGYRALEEMGLQEFAFEAVILRYPHLFSNEAVEKSRERLKGWQRGDT